MCVFFVGPAFIARWRPEVSSFFVCLWDGLRRSQKLTPLTHLKTHIVAVEAVVVWSTGPQALSQGICGNGQLSKRLWASPSSRRTLGSKVHGLSKEAVGNTECRCFIHADSRSKPDGSCAQFVHGRRQPRHVHSRPSGIARGGNSGERPSAAHASHIAHSSARGAKKALGDP